VATSVRGAAGRLEDLVHRRLGLEVDDRRVGGDVIGARPGGGRWAGRREEGGGGAVGARPGGARWQQRRGERRVVSRSSATAAWGSRSPSPAAAVTGTGSDRDRLWLRRDGSVPQRLLSILHACPAPCVSLPVALVASGSVWW
jgi:hypothetical protein